MTKRKDYLTMIIICLLLITSISGVLSFQVNHSYDVVNQYGQTVTVFGYGIYAHDTYLQAAISCGTDLAELLFCIPLFLAAYVTAQKKKDYKSELKLLSMYGVSLYYAASVLFGNVYNFLFLIYVVLFSCCLFGMFARISMIQSELVLSRSKGRDLFLVLSVFTFCIKREQQEY